MEIRRVRSQDAPRLKELRLTALADAPHAFCSTHEREAGRPAEHWEDLARRGSSDGQEAIFVAVEDDTWHGMAAAYVPDENGPVLWGMWVDGAARGRGAGRALVEAIVEWARHGGATSMRLWVIEGNEPAEALFRAAGFERTGDTAPLDDGSGRVEVSMSRAL